MHDEGGRIAVAGVDHATLSTVETVTAIFPPGKPKFLEFSSQVPA